MSQTVNLQKKLLALLPEEGIAETAITNASPIQYIKSIRLHEARRKILFDHHSASNAAFDVGYASPSQFSREYRRLFGKATSVDIRVTGNS